MRRSEIRRILNSALTVPKKKLKIEPIDGFPKKGLCILAITDGQIAEISDKKNNFWSNPKDKNITRQQKLKALGEKQAGYLDRYIREITLNQVTPLIMSHRAEKRFGPAPFPPKFEVIIWEEDIQKLQLALQIHIQVKAIMKLEEQLDDIEIKIFDKQNENCATSTRIGEYGLLTEKTPIKTQVSVDISYQEFLANRYKYFSESIPSPKVERFKSYIPNQLIKEVDLEKSVLLKINYLKKEIAEATFEYQRLINRSIYQGAWEISLQEESGKSEGSEISISHS